MRATRDSIADVWGDRTPYDGEGKWPVRVDARVNEEPERWVQSCCVLCSHGCAVDVGVKGGSIVGIRGRSVDRVNRGRLGPKGLHGWVANASPDRLTRPLVRKHGKLAPASWDEAMGLVIDRSKSILAAHGPGAIGFYNTGQLFLEEYYTLSIIARAGVQTNHLDGNTRLCTATAAAALITSFGTDGNPGCYEDFDVTDAIFLVGHNLAATQTVLWSRVLDRRRGPRPPKLVVVDPRRTDTAAEADVHLQPRVGTNVALLNGLLHLLIRNGNIDRAFIDAHTQGFENLEETVRAYTPERVHEVTQVPAERLLAAAEVIGTSRTLVSTCLQGVYQSFQATAAAVQVTNINLVRGMIGRPGCTVFQMNGQPSAQNTRETGANGELAALLNWDNDAHVQRLARHWNVEPKAFPHYAPPTHAMNIFRYAEEGSLRMLWIVSTNPAVSLPELSRIRRILEQKSLFVIAQDAFPTETTELADVVLPAAIWAEKTGTLTNADRTVHIAHKAIEPPGEARSDFDIFLDYARRMGLQDKDGKPLVKWSHPEEAFDHFKELTRGRPCDYSGLSYAKLSGGSGIQWPCNEQYPEGCARLYTDHRFHTGVDECETYGHDLLTGAGITRPDYAARDPDGRARLEAADYVPPFEEPDTEYPFWLTTGRVVHHFHTRTKTARSRELNEAAPRAEVEISHADARRFGIRTGDKVLVESRRGKVVVHARVAEILEGHLFLPFHYGHWDKPGEATAANELTLTAIDPVSKQPQFKYAAARIRRKA